MQESYVIYQSIKAAEDMFAAMKLLPGKIKFLPVDYIDEETAAANLELAQMQQAIDAVG